jgi:hypothetical protein
LKVVAEGSDEGGYIEDMVPAIVAELSAGALGSRQLVEDEIDLMFRTIREFHSMEPDQVLILSSAISARASEMSVHLHRLENKHREWRQIRTMQVNVVLAELDRQFKDHSRLIEVRRQDLELIR